MGNSPQNGASVHTFYTDTAWIEGRAEDQLRDTASWPGMISVAGFPDLHPGRYGPVGAAFLADRVYPQLVGPDIGCGMALFRISLPRHKLRLDKAVKRLAVLDEATGMGSIGGGNHFCEIQEIAQADPDAGLSVGDLCLLVHTGSRNMGARIFMGTDTPWAAGYLDGSDAAHTYLTLHDAACVWAAQNRQTLADTVAQALRCEAELICDSVHNHVERTDAGWLHRKGAARFDAGLAPLAGSRDAVSFLMRQDPTAPITALHSASHGAGRRHDRASMHGRIRKTKSGLAEMSRNPFGGVVVCENPDLMIEEAGKAYKDASAVMADLSTLKIAHPIATLKPLITYKTGVRS